LPQLDIGFDGGISTTNPALSLATELFEKTCSSTSVGINITKHLKDVHKVFCLTDDAHANLCSERTFPISSLNGWQKYPNPTTVVLSFDLVIPSDFPFEFSSFESRALEFLIQGRGRVFDIDLSELDMRIRKLTLSNVSVNLINLSVKPEVLSLLELKENVTWRNLSNIPVRSNVAIILMDYLNLPRDPYNLTCNVTEFPGCSVDFSGNSVYFSVVNQTRSFLTGDVFHLQAINHTAIAPDCRLSAFVSIETMNPIQLQIRTVDDYFEYPIRLYGLQGEVIIDRTPNIRFMSGTTVVVRSAAVSFVYHQTIDFSMRFEEPITFQNLSVRALTNITSIGDLAIRKLFVDESATPFTRTEIYEAVTLEQSAVLDMESLDFDGDVQLLC
jgi:hypothetical protein